MTYFGYHIQSIIYTQRILCRGTDLERKNMIRDSRMVLTVTVTTRVYYYYYGIIIYYRLLYIFF
jgi:hypothetical protein